MRAAPSRLQISHTVTWKPAVTNHLSPVTFHALPHSSPRSDRPDGLDFAAAHAYEVVVEIDRRIAMTRDQPELVAHGVAARAVQFQHAVLVREPHDLDRVVARHPRIARV